MWLLSHSGSLSPSCLCFESQLCTVSGEVCSRRVETWSELLICPHASVDKRQAHILKENNTASLLLLSLSLSSLSLLLDYFPSIENILFHSPGWSGVYYVVQSGPKLGPRVLESQMWTTIHGSNTGWSRQCHGKTGRQCWGLYAPCVCRSSALVLRGHQSHKSWSCKQMLATMWVGGVFCKSCQSCQLSSHLSGPEVNVFKTSLFLGVCTCQSAQVESGEHLWVSAFSSQCADPRNWA